MADIDFATLPSVLSNVPPEGYHLETVAAQAKAQREPVRLRFITGITGEDGTWPEIVITIDADGRVTMPSGYQPVIADGVFGGWHELEPADG